MKKNRSSDEIKTELIEKRKREEKDRLESTIYGDLKGAKISIWNPDMRRGITFTEDGIELNGPEESIAYRRYSKTIFKKVWNAIKDDV